MNRNYLMAGGIFLVVGVMLFALLAFFVAPRAGYGGAAPSGDLDAQMMQVAKGLYCPVCPGVPLDVCDTQACQQWRGLIREKLGQGQTQIQIETYFVEQYGQRVLGAPRAEGINILMYAIPAVTVALGAALLYLFAQRRTTLQTARVGGDGTVALNPYRSRIERELKEND